MINLKFEGETPSSIIINQFKANAELIDGTILLPMNNIN